MSESAGLPGKDIAVSAQAESELMRLVVEAAPNALILVSREGRIAMVNAQAEKLFGYPRAELLAQPLEILVPERFRGAHPGHRADFFANPQPRAMGAGRDLFGLRKDGSEIPIEIGLNPLVTGEGTFVLAAVIDISERKRNEEEHERVTRELRLLLESTGEGIYGIDLEGRFMFINLAALDLLGYRREELLGRNAHVVIHHTRNDGSPYPVEECPIFRAFRTAQGCRRDDEILWRKNGTSFPAEYASYPILHKGGCTGAVVTFSDITERKRAEAQLREAHNQLETRVRERTDELASINESLRAEIAQRRQVEAVMTGDQEVLGLIAAGRPVSSILETLAHNLEAQTSGALCSILLLDADGVHLRHGAAPSLPEAYNRAIDGVAIGPGVGSCGTAAFLRQQVIVADIATDPLWANFKDLALGHGLRACWSTPIQGAAGPVLGTFAMYYRQPRSPTPKDFATIDRATYLAGIAIEREQAEEALLRAKEDLENKVVERTAQLQVATEQAQAADRLKSAFLATMSHELRTPLNSIIGFTGIILQGLAGPLNPEQEKQLGMVQGSARHLLALINDILDISKIEAGEIKVIHEPFDLRASIVKVAGIVQPLAEQKGLTLRVDLAPEIGMLMSDQRRVEQVLLNLLNNAVKFTDRGGVTLHAGIVAPPSGPAVSVQVIDTGSGIKPEDFEKLFKPFQQVDGGLSRPHEGTGLGLAICKRLINLLGGDIGVQSVWGEGSTFEFLLPLLNSDSPAVQGR